jgi:general stress protein YciG
MEPKRKRGFAAMSPERLREVSGRGGKNSPANFKNNRERARKSGQKGGRISRPAKAKDE